MSGSEIRARKSVVYGINSFSCARVLKGDNGLLERRVLLKDSNRPEQARRVITHFVIAAVGPAVGNDKRWKEKYIWLTLPISHGTLHAIFIEIQKLSRICAQRVSKQPDGGTDVEQNVGIAAAPVTLSR